ncbi:hypothetical protein PR202_ga18811 [Eleusine coracana subsp. coracana]|uniref:Uncharacterized protein n=1 Tax=Eleusine coracana subsp. coracana TaxID=191504 RepID=A0AAV5CUB9_ELECO|nr:hypothetical protein PR202_ga18811 [Eleusine coracana subsp. coracana]
MDPQLGNDMTAYIAFMSQFVSTSEDAALLIRKGIIVHMLAMFTRLGTHMHFDFGADNYHYLKILCFTLEQYYQNRLNRWMAWLWRNHFSNPCTLVHTAASRGLPSAVGTKSFLAEEGLKYPASAEEKLGEHKPLTGLVAMSVVLIQSSLPLSYVSHAITIHVDGTGKRSPTVRMSQVQRTNVKQVNMSELVGAMTQELDYYWSLAVTKLVQNRLESYETAGRQETIAANEAKPDNMKTEYIITEDVLACEESIGANNKEAQGSLFRNLIAFEQTCPQFGDDFTAYSVFLSQLVSMPEDVTLLAQREIIVHHLDSDEKVSDLFTMLSKDVVFDFNGNYYLKSLCQTMEAHYQSRINRWMAWPWHNHFSNPWLAVAAFATIIVLVCTIV